MSPAKPSPRFLTPLDTWVTPLVFVLILSLAGAAASFLRMRFHLDFFLTFAGFYGAFLFCTFGVLLLIRLIFPPREGVFSFSSGKKDVFLWNLTGFLYVVNLSPFYTNLLIPVPFRSLFYRLLGARFGSGIQVIGGRLTDPTMITFGDSVIVGDDSLIMGHAITVSAAGDTLILARTTLHSRVLIGARSTIFPGVTIGEGSVVSANSIVPMNTRIPAHESWGGTPAVKLKDLPRPG